MPQWKRDLEGQEDSNSPSKRPAVDNSSAEASRGTESTPAPAPSALVSSSGAASSTPANSGAGGPPEDDDDDDDDNFDPSVYDLDAGEADEGDEKPPWAEPQSTEPQPPPTHEAVKYLPGGRYNDFDGQDTICFHGKGASNAVCQDLVGALPGYRATRFVKGLVFVLFADQLYAISAMEKLNRATLIDESGTTAPIRCEWAKRSLRPF